MTVLILQKPRNRRIVFKSNNFERRPAHPNQDLYADVRCSPCPSITEHKYLVTLRLDPGTSSLRQVGPTRWSASTISTSARDTHAMTISICVRFANPRTIWQRTMMFN
jgi:hypothetical protein